MTADAAWQFDEDLGGTFAMVRDEADDGDTVPPADEEDARL